jgi:L-aminopeptidase/D-esterase-like protein
MILSMSASLGMGFHIGHWTDRRAGTGCTVILPPPGNVASCDVRGSSPSSRELELLHVERRLTEIHAILLTGGSAFGLAAAEGVVEWLAERDIGYRTHVRRVPIVPAAVIFDLHEANIDKHPRARAGYEACRSATAEPVATGRVGAGTGATAGKWAGPRHSVPAGLGMHRAAAEGLEVSSVAVANPVGDIIDSTGSVLAGTRAPRTNRSEVHTPVEEAGDNTVIALVATRAYLDKRDVRWLAQRGSDGITLAVRPAHTRYDGDVVFAVAAPLPGDEAGRRRLVAPAIDVLGRLATEAVAGAVRNAVA